MEPKASFIQVRMSQRVNDVDPLVLFSSMNNFKLKKKNKKTFPRIRNGRHLKDNYGIKDKHLAEEVDGLVGGLRRESVERGQ